MKKLRNISGLTIIAWMWPIGLSALFIWSACTDGNPSLKRIGGLVLYLLIGVAIARFSIPPMPGVQRALRPLEYTVVAIEWPLIAIIGLPVFTQLAMEEAKKNDIPLKLWQAIVFQCIGNCPNLIEKLCERWNLTLSEDL